MLNPNQIATEKLLSGATLIIPALSDSRLNFRLSANKFERYLKVMHEHVPIVTDASLLHGSGRMVWDRDACHKMQWYGRILSEIQLG